MVIFAVLGAVTAYRGARTEQDTVAIAEKLAQGELIEVGERQRLRTQTASAAALWAREDAVWWAGQALARSAESARRDKRLDEAAWLTMRAQEEFAAARAIRHVRAEFASRMLPVDQENLRVAAALADMGFGTFVHFQAAEAAGDAAETKGHVPARPSAATCHQSTGMELSQVWCATRARLEDLHGHVRTSSLVVAAFVLALTFFTISDASAKARWPQLKWWFLCVGLVVGVSALVVVLVRDDGTAWPWLVGALVATPLAWLGLHYAVAYAERKHWVHPEKGEGSVHSEEVAFERAALRAPVLGHHIEHWFGIVTIVLIAAMVFVSAAVGWGYSVASTHADADAQEARKAAAEMVIRGALFASRQSELVRELASTAERRVRLGLANQRVQLAKFADAMKARHDDEETRHANELRSYRAQFSDLETLMDADTLSVEGDPIHPSRLLWQFLRSRSTDVPPETDQARGWRKDEERSQRSRNVYEAFAQWDLNSGRSVAWRSVATRLLAALTIFAIALYFLGQALAMEPTRSGYVLLIAGIVFGCFGVGSSLVSASPMVRLSGFDEATPQQLEAVLAEAKCPAVYSDFSTGPERRYELAAYFFGIGTAIGDSRSDAGDLERAERYFKCAVALNADFAYARLKLAVVKSKLASLDFGEPYFGLPARDKVQGTADLKQARDLLQRAGLDLSTDQRSSLAYETALNALITRDEEALVQADATAQETLDLVTGGRILAQPHTAALLDFNLGFVRLARGRFDEARKDYKAGLAVETGDAFRVSSLTDLETVWLLRCEDAATAAGTKFDCAGLRSALIDIRRAMLSHQPSGGQSPQARVKSQDDFKVSATANHLFAHLRGVDPEADDLWLVWSRLEPGWEMWRTLQRVSRPVTAPRKQDDTVVMNAGTLSVRRSFLGSYWGSKTCLAEGHYRADLYSHGTLIATRPVDLAMPQMKAARFPELNLHLCLPPGWTALPEKAKAAEQRSNYGVVRGVNNGANKAAAFVFSFYLPTQSDGLTSCLVPSNALRCAISSLTSIKMISGNEPLLAFEDLSASVDRRALVHRTWMTQDGGVHVVIARADSGTVNELRNLLESAETIYDEKDIDTTLQPK